MPKYFILYSSLLCGTLLEAAIKWEQNWLMSFHPDKCNIMNITTKRNPIHFYYNMHGHILKSVQHAKYLGVTISRCRMVTDYSGVFSAFPDYSG
jgi:predicted oxidoreductase